MECRRYDINPEIALSCPCPACIRHDQMMWDLEGAVAGPVGVLLAAGWMPSDIVDAVKTGSPKTSRAPMLVRIEVVCRAGTWLDSPGMELEFLEAKQLGKYTGFKIGSTMPGWFFDWFRDKARRDLVVAARAVRQVGEALEPIIGRLEPDGVRYDAGADASAQELARSRPGRPFGNVIPFPTQRRWRS